MPELVLASSSPRRALLLSSAGYQFAQVSPDLDETPLEDESPEQLVVRLARAKALAANPPNAVSLGADTAVVLEGESLGKPADRDEAVSMLRRLGGRTHAVVTGWALARDGGVIEDGLEVTLLTLRSITVEEAEDYAATGEPMDKAGAYGIQGLGGALVESVQGSYSNVVGLPLAEVVSALLKNNVITIS